MSQSLDSSNVEIIVVDDCSPTDRMSELSASFPEVRFVRHSSNRGPGAARNTGISQANGRYLAFIDSDAVAPIHWLRNYKRVFEAGAVAACGSVYHQKDFLSKMTAITAFGAHLKQRHGPRTSFAAANFAISAETMQRFSFNELVRPAGEDMVLSRQIVNAGVEILYNAKAWVMHKPTMTPKDFFRRAYQYGRGFRIARIHEPSLTGSGFHRYAKGASGFLLLPARVLIDLTRAFEFREAVNIRWWEFPAAFGLILLTRIVWAAGVTSSYFHHEE